MKMFVGLVLFAAFALPAAFAAHQDVITLQAYEQLLKNGVPHEMTKTVISNPVLEEALVSYSKKKLGGLPTCGETCTLGTCYTPGCTCSWPLCTKNSLETQDVITLQAYEELLKNGMAVTEMKKTVISNPVLEEALVSYSKERLGGLPTCGETCTLGTCYTPGCTCSWPLCTKNSLEITKSTNPLPEEAVTVFAKKGLGDFPL